MTTKAIIQTVAVLAVLSAVTGFVVFSQLPKPSVNVNTPKIANQNGSVSTATVSQSSVSDATQALVSTTQQSANQPKATQTVPVQTPNKTVDSDSDKIFISATELADANSNQKCYVAFKGEVFDITSFLPNHPGGASKPVKQCGKVIDSFSEIHPGGEFDSPKVQAMLRARMIGSLGN